MASNFNWSFCDIGNWDKVPEGRKKSTASKWGIRIGDPVTMLVPDEFGGKAVEKTVIADGDFLEHGEWFAGQNVYVLLAEWNRRALHDWALLPESERPWIGYGDITKEAWFPFYTDLSLSPEQVTEKMAALYNRETRTKGLQVLAEAYGMTDYPIWEYRYIGIAIDELSRPFYPAKFAKDASSTYEDCSRSPRNPGLWLGVMTDY